MSQSAPPPSGNPLGSFSDPIEMMKKFWSPFGLPMPMPGAMGPMGAMGNANPMAGMVFPTTDPAEIDKRIAELRSVETWLSMNLEMVRATAQAFETQKTTLAAFQSMQSNIQSGIQAALSTMQGQAASAASPPPAPAAAAPSRKSSRRKSP